MAKITFIGAGSLVFTKNLVRDLLTFPAFEGCTIALVDIDEERLGFAKQAVHNIIAAGNYSATMEATTDRVKALPGSNGNREKRKENWKKSLEQWRDSPIDLKRGGEYAAYIFNAVFGDGTLFQFNGKRSQYRID